MLVHRLVHQQAWAASGQFRVEFSKFPRLGPGGLHTYLRSLLFNFRVTDLDTGAGGGVTALEIYNMLVNSLTVEAGGGNVHGPRSLNGAQLHAFRQQAVGATPRYQSAEGDAATAANESNEVRDVLLEVPYWALGADDGDFAKSIASLADAGGAIQVNFGALATNASALAAVCDVYAELEAKPDVIAVPPVIIEATSVPALVNAPVGGPGRMLYAMLQNAGAWVAGDVSNIELRGDGQPYLSGIDQRLALALMDPAIAAMEVQVPLIAQAGATAPRFQPVFPVRPGDKRISKKPYATDWTATIVGNESASNLTWLTCKQYVLRPEEAISQARAMDLRAAGGDARPKTASKGPIPPHLIGSIPLRFA